MFNGGTSILRRNLITASAAAAAGAAVCNAAPVAAPGGIAGLRPAGDFGLKSSNTPARNKTALQSAIDWAAEIGGTVLIEPTDEPCAVESGLQLRMNASLAGLSTTVPRGTRHPSKPQPVGSVLRIEDAQKPFITVEAATQIAGIQFWYPEQTLLEPSKVIEYPPTISSDKFKLVQGVTMQDLTFFGEYQAFDFKAGRKYAAELMRFEHCFGYPLSGRFIEIDYCYDIPRLLHCHVNPAIRRFIDGQYSRAVVDSVVQRGTYAYSIDHTDNAQMMDIFTFGTWGGIRLGPATYGQLTNFNLDCVAVGIHKTGDSQFNRNWQIAQGSIIANAGRTVQDNHPIIIDGEGHTALSAVESFSGGNGALSTPSVDFRGTKTPLSNEYLLVNGEKPLTVSMFGCRMSNYYADKPVVVNNPNAQITAYGCFHRRGNDNSVLPFEI
jgi:hypothetical protein